MAATRIEIDTLLVQRLSGLLTEVGFSVQIDGANADLIDPLGAALRELGYAQASIAAVTDADLAAVPADDYNRLLDLAEARVLESAFAQIVKVDERAGPLALHYSQLADRLERRLARKWEQIQSQHGLYTPSPVAGVITLQIAQHDED